MRELQDIYRSKNFKDGETGWKSDWSDIMSFVLPLSGLYTVELIDDCLYSWNIKLFRLLQTQDVEKQNEHCLRVCIFVPPVYALVEC